MNQSLKMQNLPGATTAAATTKILEFQMPDENMVLRGLDDWLFLQNDSNRTLDQISGRYELPPDFWTQWRNLFKFRSNKLKDLGVRYFYSVAPNKESVYRRFLPPQFKFSEKRPVEAVRSAAAGLVNFEYPLAELIHKSMTEFVYSRGDTHWNGRGGYIFYKATMAALKLEEVDPERVGFHTESRSSDLSSKIGVLDVYDRLVVRNTSARIVENNGVTNIGGRVVFQNNRMDLPKAVIFRDSFSSNLLQLYAESFSRVVFIWQPNIDYTIVEAEMPDVVISQQAERFLVSCPDDLHGRTHPEWVEWKKSFSQN